MPGKLARAILYFEVDPEEKRLLEARAKARGWPTARYVRMLINHGLEVVEGDDAPAVGEERSRWA